MLTGQAAAEEAGPAITISFVVAGIVAALAALCYAEFAAMVPVAVTLFAFVLVAGGILYLRRAQPERERPFRTPFVPFVPILAIAASLYLMASLSGGTWLRFGIWMLLG